MHIITTHNNADFDGLASIIAATKLYPQAIGVVPSATNRNVTTFLSIHKRAFTIAFAGDIDYEKITRLTIVDTNQWYRIEKMEKLKGRDIEIEVWDHHLSNPGDIEADKFFIEPSGSTVSILIKAMIAKKIELNPLDATVLLLGLYEDTGHLSFPSTTPMDAKAAVYLLENNADLNIARNFLSPPYEKAQQNALFDMMEYTDRHTINGLTIGICHITPENKVPGLAEIVQLYLRITGIDALFCLLQLKDRHTIIGRSSVPRINIGQILQHFGGGGHPGAGSASVRSEIGSPEESEKTLLGLLEKHTAAKITIAKLMSSPVITVDPTVPMHEIRKILDEKNIRGLVVMDQEEICGLINLWDLKRVRKEQQWDSPVKAFMTRDIVTVSPDITPIEATKIIIEKKIGYLPIVQKGKLIGIITRSDILRYFYKLK